MTQKKLISIKLAPLPLQGATQESLDKHNLFHQHLAQMSFQRNIIVLLAKNLDKPITLVLSGVEVKIENHIGAIWNFAHYYNANITPILSRQS